MIDDLPEELRIEYSPLNYFYQGKAEGGGPRDGETLTSTTLTQFVPRTVKNKAPFIVPGSTLNMDPEERKKLRQAEKEALEESTWAKNNPHRYDFDLDRKVWIYHPYNSST